MLILGSHVSFGKDQLSGCVKEALSYGANAFMFYTNNTIRSELHDEYNKTAIELMSEKIDMENVICHAPYIINLANNKDPIKYKFSIEFLKNEIVRCHHLGVKKIVLHPGSAVGIERDIALKNISYALNIVLEEDEDVMIALETMAGKGNELGVNLDELKTIIDGVDKNNLVGICLDTCHLNDSGEDISNFDKYLDEVDQKIGLERVLVVHINDSKNECGSRKDRHELIGFGTIGFENLLSVIYSSRLENIPKILETPYIGDTDDSKERKYPPYKFEIEEIKNRVFNADIKKDIRNYYEK